ncbi:MAG: LPS export ABC transporter periplasmic protein LptC [Cyanophyceae cyanobacterium]
MSLLNLRRRWLFKACLLLAVSLSACQSASQSEQAVAPEPSELEPRLVLNNAALEQASSEGESQWKIAAERVEYSQDRQIASLEKITANIFQEGEIALQISANRGRILQREEKFFLEGEVIATDPRNGAVIRCEEVEWDPQKSKLTARHELRGSHQNLAVSAEIGRYFSQAQRLELAGNIVATAQEPRLQLTTERLVWELPLEKVSSDVRVQLVRYKEQTATDRVVADQTEVDLASQTAHLQQNVELRSLDPPINIAASSVVWNYRERQLKADRPLQVVHRQEQVTVIGNRGQIDLEQEMARLSEGVEGRNDRHQAKLYSRELTWTISSQTVEAIGNVVYEQTNPPARLTGTKAVGKLQDNRVAVTGTASARVVTRIVP